MLCRRFVANFKGRRDNSRNTKKKTAQSPTNEIRALKKTNERETKVSQNVQKWGHLRSRHTRTLLILLKSTNKLLEGHKLKKTVKETKKPVISSRVVQSSSGGPFREPSGPSE